MDTLVIVVGLVLAGALGWLAFKGTKLTWLKAPKASTTETPDVTPVVTESVSSTKKKAVKKPNFADMTKKELIEYAASKGHKLPSYLSKDKMVNAVKAL